MRIWGNHDRALPAGIRARAEMEFALLKLEVLPVAPARPVLCDPLVPKWAVSYPEFVVRSGGFTATYGQWPPSGEPSSPLRRTGTQPANRQQAQGFPSEVQMLDRPLLEKQGVPRSS
jgi:hypothetical protein